MFVTATIEDLNTIEELMKALLDDSKYKGFLSADVTKEAICAFLDPYDHDKRICYLVKEEEKVIGFFMCEAVGIDHLPTKLARIVTVYLKPDYRNKGYMSQILDVFEDWGSHCDYYNLGVSVDGVDITNRGYKQYEVLYMKKVG